MAASSHIKFSKSCIEINTANRLLKSASFVADRQRMLIRCRSRDENTIFQHNYWRSAARPIYFREYMARADGRPLIIRIPLMASSTLNRGLHITALTYRAMAVPHHQAGTGRAEASTKWRRIEALMGRLVIWHIDCRYTYRHRRFPASTSHRWPRAGNLGHNINKIRLFKVGRSIEQSWECHTAGAKFSH